MRGRSQAWWHLSVLPRTWRNAHCLKTMQNVAYVFHRTRMAWSCAIFHVLITSTVLVSSNGSASTLLVLSANSTSYTATETEQSRFSDNDDTNYLTWRSLDRHRTHMQFVYILANCMWSCVNIRCYRNLLCSTSPMPFDGTVTGRALWMRGIQTWPLNGVLT